VTDIIRALVHNWTLNQLDDVHFWRLHDKEGELNLAGAVALTKIFMLELSNEFDYQMYHDPPIKLKFV
jgi:hypothetical protein